MFACPWRRLSAWISRSFLTYEKVLTAWKRGGKICGVDTLSMEIFSFMHLMATSFPVLMFCALITSEKVPSPIFDISLYSRKINGRKGLKNYNSLIKKIVIF